MTYINLQNLVAKLRETSQAEPTRQAVADLLKQVTATAEEDDIVSDITITC